MHKGSQLSVNVRGQLDLLFLIKMKVRKKRKKRKKRKERKKRERECRY